MKITPLVPDISVAPPRLPKNDVNEFSTALDAAGDALRHADSAESAFASGSGGLQDAVLERANADVVLSVATAAAQRTAQTLSTILSMQV